MCHKKTFNFNEYFTSVLRGHMFSVNTLIRRDFLIINHIGYDESLGYLEDVLFWVAMLSKRPTGKYINQSTYIYRANVPTSATGTPISDKKIMDQISVAKAITELAGEFYGTGYKAVFEYGNTLAFHAYRMIYSHGIDRTKLERHFKMTFRNISMCGTINQKCFTVIYNNMPKLTPCICSVLVSLNRLMGRR